VGDSTNEWDCETPRPELVEQLWAFISRIRAGKEGVNYLSNEVATRYLRVKRAEKPERNLKRTVPIFVRFIDLFAIDRAAFAG
jgi:hypothetical protein